MKINPGIILPKSGPIIVSCKNEINLLDIPSLELYFQEFMASAWDNYV
jgi:hypothetical protein